MKASRKPIVQLSPETKPVEQPVPESSATQAISANLASLIDWTGLECLVAEWQRTQRRDAILAAHIGPSWVVIEDHGRVAVVARNGLVGYAPTDVKPDLSYFCFGCGNYGPWNGSRCLSCGRVSFDD